MTDTGTGTGRILAIKVISPVQGYDRGFGSFHGRRVQHVHERTSGVGRRMRERGGDAQKSAPPTTIFVIQQWICLVLGLVCMAFGMWGICMKPEQDALSAYIAWLGSLYMPTLHVTAAICIGLGVMLVRRGWAHL
jgi:hypothetical protein